MNDRTDFEREWGRQTGWDDGAHSSGVMIHLAHRDPEAWAEQSEDFRKAYEEGWEAAR